MGVVKKITDTAFGCSILWNETAIWRGSDEAVYIEQKVEEVFGKKESCREFDHSVIKFEKKNLSFLAHHLLKKKLFFQVNEVVFQKHLKLGSLPLSFTRDAWHFIALRVPIALSLSYSVDPVEAEDPLSTLALAAIVGATAIFHLGHCGGSMVSLTCENI